MQETLILKNLVVLLAATIPIVFFFQKAKLPLVVGFLVAGMVIGPYGLRLIEGTWQVEVLAEIGVILLLFAVGLEFSLGRLLQARRQLLWGGGLQVLLTTVMIWAIARAAGSSTSQAIFFGFLVALSSTAIVLKLLADRAEIDAPQGRLAVTILLFQDLCVVPMMLLIPGLGDAAEVSWGSIAWTLAKALGALILIVAAARLFLPKLLHQIARLRVREVFTLVIVFIGFGTAWATSALGLSLALGAFIAGLVISESEYSHQAVSEILPLRDTFSGIFFISVGMLLRLSFAFDHALRLLAIALLIFSVKFLITSAVAWSLARSVRIGTMVGLSLAQIGEFSFILAKAGQRYGLLSESDYQGFLAASILTMLATPFLISIASEVGFRLEGALRMRTAVRSGAVTEDEHLELQDHVIIVGYGLNGQNVSRVLREVGIPYVVLELNPDTVRKTREQEEYIYYGDATRPELLQKARVGYARALVVAISDPAGTRRIVALARRLNDKLYILVRTRYVAEIDDLYRLGANQVIPEEFETSIEIVSRVLREYHVPRNVIALQVDLIRREGYGMMRGLHLPARTLDQLQQILAATTTDTFLVVDDSPAVGKTLEELNLRGLTGVTIIAAVRGGRPLTNPGPDYRIKSGDVLVMLGSHAQIDAASQILSPRERSRPDEAP